MFAGGAAMAGAAALLGMALGFVPAPPLPQAGLGGLGLALSLGFLASNVALQYGAARLNAHTTALIMLSEVVFASLSSVALGAAELTLRTLARRRADTRGGSMVSLAVPTRPGSGAGAQ